MKSREDIENMTPNQLVSWFMIGSYAYYRLGERVMEDQDFDFLVYRLKEEYDNADHYHKSYITEEHLRAGTGYDIDFPSIVKGAYNNYMREWLKGDHDEISSE